SSTDVAIILDKMKPEIATNIKNLMNPTGTKSTGTKPKALMALTPNPVIRLTCNDDDYCKNINQQKSIPGQDIVYVCPDATCVSGTCHCGSNCKLDPYTSVCCKDVEYDKNSGDTF